MLRYIAPLFTNVFTPLFFAPINVGRLPREKPAPKPKPLSKWEEYAKAKGISRNKKGKKVWDTELKVITISASY